MSELVPVQRDILLAVWPKVVSGVRECLAQTDGELDERDVEERIADGSFLLLLGIKDGCFCGFVIAEKQLWPQAKHLLLFMVWVKPGCGFDFLEEFDPAVREIAKQHGCQMISFLSSRRANRSGEDFEKRMAQFGFEPGYTFYRKKVS